MTDDKEPTERHSAAGRISEDPDSEALGEIAAKGIFWVGAGRAFRQIIGVGTSIVLARSIAPESFGLIVMALAAIEFGQLFADLGVGTAIVQQRTGDSLAWSSAFWVNLAVGIALCVLISAVAPAIAAFYAEPSLTWVIVALSSSLLVSALQVVPRALLSRSMRFDLIAQSEVGGGVAGSAAAIIMAVNGFGVWSLAAQPLVGAMMTFVLIGLASGWLPDRSFHWPAVRPLAHFSVPLLGTEVLHFLATNTDRVLIGRFLGGASLGFYGLATQIMLYPLANVTAVVGRVLFPIFSRMQDQRSRMRDAYIKTTSAVAAITFPAMLGLYVVASDFVAVVFGERWAPMVPILEILCWVGLTHSITGTLANIYLSTGNTLILWRLGLLAAPLTVIGYIAGLRWGAVGVAAGYAIVTYILLYFKLRLALRLIDLPIGKFFLSLSRPFGTAIAMAAGVMVVHSVMKAGGTTPLMRLLVSIATGACLYIASNLVVNRGQWLEIFSLCRRAVSQQSST